MPSPLFMNAAKDIQDSARRAFHQSSLGRLMGKVDRARRTPGAMTNVVQRYGKKFRARDLIREVNRGDFGQLLREVEYYAKGNALTQRVLGQFLKALGPAGQLIGLLTGGAGAGGGSSSSLEKDIQVATDFLVSQGRVVIPPTGHGASRGEMGVPGLISYLESLGHKVVPPGAEPEEKSGLPFGLSAQTKSGRQRKSILAPSWDSGRAKNKRFPVDHPGVTGEWVHPRSSNVHSYSYDIEQSILYIRYLTRTSSKRIEKRPGHAGSLYKYEQVTPHEFDRFHKAPSKGQWIWDELRVRGTVAGYQKPYALAGVMPSFARGKLHTAYVPRHAQWRGEIKPGDKPGTKRGEWYVQRRVKTSQGRWAQSQLPTERATGAPNRGAPNTGAPNTGAPNTGAPNTGAP